MKAAGLLLPFLVATLAATPLPSAIVQEEFVHEPGAYPQCHASTIAETSDGALIAAWFGGTHERHPDVCIYARRAESGQWQPESRVADGVQSDGKRYPCWNPVLFQPNHGPLLLFYKVGPSPSRWWGMLKTSSDGGRTWSAAHRLPDGILGPIKDKPVELPDGTLLCGSSTEDSPAGWRIHFEMTADCGATWRRTPPIAGGGFQAIQPTLLTHADGRLQLLGRTKEMVVVTSWSTDEGRTWSALEPSGLYAPNSGLDAVTLADGRHLLVYNYRASAAHGPANSKAQALGTPKGEAVPPAENWGARWPLNVALSPDGVNWKMVLTLESEPRRDGYAYPAVIQTHDGLVHVTYTWDRVRIKHVVLDPKRL